jgi:hypothetical protein
MIIIAIIIVTISTGTTVQFIIIAGHFIKTEECQSKFEAVRLSYTVFWNIPGRLPVGSFRDIEVTIMPYESEFIPH